MINWLDPQRDVSDSAGKIWTGLTLAGQEIVLNPCQWDETGWRSVTGNMSRFKLT